MRSHQEAVTSLSDELAHRQNAFHSGMARMIANQMHCLCRVLALESGDRVIAADEFELTYPVDPAPSRTSTPSSKTPRSWLQYLPAYTFTEPRMMMIARFLRHLQRIGSFISDGLARHIDGFSLVNHDYWATYPYESALASVGTICSHCDCECKFCYRNGSPMELLGPRMLSIEETLHRLKYYDPDKRLGLPCPIHETGEVFLNKKLCEIIAHARIRDDNRVFREITTNGNYLTRDRIDALARMAPILLVVSVNSSHPTTRAGLMGCRENTIALDAIPILSERRIPFIGSIVPWPDVSADDFRKTIQMLDNANALSIRVCLPSFTRFGYTEPPFSPNELWTRVVGQILDLQPTLRTPVVVQPSWFWRRETYARIDGIIDNSPAKAAGLQPGDHIVAVNDGAVCTREEVRTELLKSANATETASLELLRDGRTIRVQLEEMTSLADDAYPYKPPGWRPDPSLMYGIHLIDGFQTTWVIAVKQIIKKHPEAESILILTSLLGEELFERVIEILESTGEFYLPYDRISVSPVHSHYWGGNIVVGDLNLVWDYIRHIEDVCSDGFKPDLVLIPSSFTLGRWGLDVFGNNYREIERRTGCRVELVPVRPVMT